MGFGFIGDFLLKSSDLLHSFLLINLKFIIILCYLNLLKSKVYQSLNSFYATSEIKFMNSSTYLSTYMLFVASLIGPGFTELIKVFFS
jgi:hypothetical protein